MLTNRDKKVLRWIEDYKAISISQANVLFFNCYESCRRRLKQLEENKLLKSYTSTVTKEKIYYQNKKLSEHDILIFDFIKVIKQEGAIVRKLELQPRYLKDTIRPDAYVEFQLNKNVYFVLLEIDYTHYTDMIKMQLYEKLYREGSLQKRCYGTFPIIIVARPIEKLRYNSFNFDLIYTDFKFKNLKELLFT